MLKSTTTHARSLGSIKSDYYMYNYELENDYSETPSTPTSQVPLRNVNVYRRPCTYFPLRHVPLPSPGNEEFAKYHYTP